MGQEKNKNREKGKRESHVKRNRNKTKGSKRVVALLKFGLLISILVAIPLYIYFFHPDLIERFSSMENVREFFRDYKGMTIFVFVAAQVVQIIICIIPGQWIQIASGYLFGFWMAMLWSLVGAFIGTILTYYLAKILGRDFVNLIFDSETVEYYTEKLNSKKAVLVVFLIYLIPGVPKDLCNYVAGISEMKLKPFLLISMVGRTPAMMGSLLIGHQLTNEHYGGAITIAVVAVLLFVICVIFRQRIFNWFDRVYDKLMKM